MISKLHISTSTKSNTYESLILFFIYIYKYNYFKSTNGAEPPPLLGSRNTSASHARCVYNIKTILRRTRIARRHSEFNADSIRCSRKARDTSLERTADYYSRNRYKQKCHRQIKQSVTVVFFYQYRITFCFNQDL